MGTTTDVNLLLEDVDIMGVSLRNTAVVLIVDAPLLETTSVRALLKTEQLDM